MLYSCHYKAEYLMIPGIQPLKTLKTPLGISQSPRAPLWQSQSKVVLEKKYHAMVSVDMRLKVARITQIILRRPP